MFEFKKGATDVTIYVRLRDSSTGLAKTGLAYDSAGASCYYTRPLAAATQIALATQTVTGAHSDGGFVEVDGTNAKGLCRLDLPDAVCASGAGFAVVSIEFDDVIEESILIRLVDNTAKDVYDAVAALNDPAASAIADAVWGETDSDHDTADTMGARLNRIGAASVTVVSPVADDGTITIVRGDDYANADGRAIEWDLAYPTWPDLTNAAVTFTAGGFTDSLTVVSGGGSGQKVRMELTDTQTATLSQKSKNYSVTATLSGGSVVTLVLGRLVVKSGRR